MYETSVEKMYIYVAFYPGNSLLWRTLFSYAIVNKMTPQELINKIVSKKIDIKDRQLRHPLAILPGVIKKIVIRPVVSRNIYEYLKKKKKVFHIPISKQIKEEIARFFDIKRAVGVIGVNDCQFLVDEARGIK